MSQTAIYPHKTRKSLFSLKGTFQETILSRSFRFCAHFIWNSLRINTRNGPNLERFKKQRKKQNKTKLKEGTFLSFHHSTQL